MSSIQAHIPALTDNLSLFQERDKADVKQRVANSNIQLSSATFENSQVFIFLIDHFLSLILILSFPLDFSCMYKLINKTINRKSAKLARRNLVNNTMHLLAAAILKNTILKGPW